MRNLGWVIAFFITFVVNPMWVVGCLSESSEEEPTFGEDDMLALVDDLGTQDFGFSQDGEDYRLTLDLSQATEDEVGVWVRVTPPHRVGPMVTAHACGSRNFEQSAAACVTTSEMPLAGALKLERITSAGAEPIADTPAYGRLRVIGNHLTHATLDVGFSGGSMHLVSTEGMTFELRSLQTGALGDRPGADYEASADDAG